MKISDAYPSNFLKAQDIEDDTVVTIESVDMEKIGDDEKPIVRFRELNGKGLVLNKTNAQAISQALGSDETDDWEGQRITLFTTTVTFQGKPIEAIRVKMRKPKGQAPQQTSKKEALTPPDDEPEDDTPPWVRER